MTPDETLELDHPSTRCEAVQVFNKLQGRLRISVTHACQLNCRFCHQEGIDLHWRPVHIADEFLTGLVEAYSRLGGRYIELTGGEPTLHPRIGRLIEMVAGPGRELILCTNGLRLDRVQAQLEQSKVSLVKLSLHATDSSEGSKALLGNVWDFVRLERNLEAALGTGTRVQLIFTHSRQNSHYLESVLSLALLWDVDLQVVDLINSRARQPAAELGYVGGDESEDIVRGYASLIRVARDRTGAVLKLYQTPRGRTWEIKDYHYGVLHTRMCEGCDRRRECGEGVYALRVDATGIVKPCLLRDDLHRQVDTRDSEFIEDSLAEKLREMMAGGLQWN